MVPSPKLPRSCPSRAQQFLDYGSGDPANRGLGLSISLAVKSQMSQRRKPVKYNAAHCIEHVARGQQQHSNNNNHDDDEDDDNGDASNSPSKKQLVTLSDLKDGDRGYDDAAAAGGARNNSCRTAMACRSGCLRRAASRKPWRAARSRPCTCSCRCCTTARSRL